MTLPELQARLDRLGVQLTLRLVVDAPAGVLTAEIKTSLAAHKPRLLAMLAGADDQVKPQPQPAVAKTLTVPATPTPPPGRGPRDVRKGDKWLPWHGPEERGEGCL
jgi:hypothetical protein